MKKKGIADIITKFVSLQIIIVFTLEKGTNEAITHIDNIGVFRYRD